jgi:putative hemolysin
MLDLAIILVLVLMNGVLAGTEIAVLSTRRPLLSAQAQAGDVRAQRVLSLRDNPSAFLSTIQVGITLVGILAGAVGGADAVRYLAPFIATGTR